MPKAHPGLQVKDDHKAQMVFGRNRSIRKPWIATILRDTNS